jgi:hypothetical protein
MKSEKLVRDKRSCIFCRSNSDEEKKFYGLDLSRFGIIFVGAILVLCIIYGLKSTHRNVKANE